ncbi:MAG: VOC family protein [Myxococcales bacterium]|nr:VOC family protein [Myxococcales bacterium]
MSKRPAKPANMPWISPYLTIPDAARALDFYQRAFGFEKKEAHALPDGTLVHVEMVWRDGVIMFGPARKLEAKTPAQSGAQSPFGLCVYVDDVDALFARATAAGAKVRLPLEDQFYGDRSCTLVDPDGYCWTFATNIADFDPSKMPAG